MTEKEKLQAALDFIRKCQYAHSDGLEVLRQKAAELLKVINEE